jgi:hypothetical protein
VVALPLKPGEAAGFVAQRGQFGKPVRNRLAECRMVRCLHAHEVLENLAL